MLQFHPLFALLVVVGSFILGSLEGPRVWNWIKSWFVKEVTAVETKVGLKVSTGPSGVTTTAAPVVPVGHTGA